MTWIPLLETWISSQETVTVLGVIFLGANETIFGQENESENDNVDLCLRVDICHRKFASRCLALAWPTEAIFLVHRSAYISWLRKHPQHHEYQ